MPWCCNRREAMQLATGSLVGSYLSTYLTSGPATARGAAYDADWEKAIERGLKWLANTQSKWGGWTVNSYPTAMTALAGTAFLCSGSTTTQGPFAKNVRNATNYLLDNKVRSNGLIGDPRDDNRYTYGHGFAMLFLSQVLGEEEDIERRDRLMEVLAQAVEFSGRAQTKSGGWGYVSAKDGHNFDEGSTTITQVQGLRSCRNAGIPVSKDVIERAKQYIYRCKNADGGISYSSTNRGSSRPAITAAALASLYNAGDYDSKHVPEMMEYCKQNLYRIESGRTFGHWHYTYLYYSQVVYREGGQAWEGFRDKLYRRLVVEQQQSGNWQGNIGPVYVTALSLIMLQLDKGLLPIYQR
ncbi:MAG: terpene cyclase/mutase family protein [Planctomycetales bacterium]|nr:terpene cyclase/mutase family protein [Planctomycetales bacterium]